MCVRMRGGERVYRQESHVSEIPDTRASLLLRIRDPADHAAWNEFAATYQPVIYRMARRRGLQDADAHDLVQQVMASVSRAVAEFDPDRRQGRFRSWLSTVTRNAIIDNLRRNRPDRGTGGTSMLQQLQAVPLDDEAAELELQQEVRRQLFRQAAGVVREEFTPETWQAFWLTTVERVSVPEAARRLTREPGSIYAARSRVMRRLRDAILRLEQTND